MPTPPDTRLEAPLVARLARALRAELDQPGANPAEDPASLLTALATVIAAHAPPDCPCRRPPG